MGLEGFSSTALTPYNLTALKPYGFNFIKLKQKRPNCEIRAFFYSLILTV
jgi:hypothetical protein